MWDEHSKLQPKDNKPFLKWAWSRHMTHFQGCYRYFPKVSPIFDIDTGLKSIVDTDIDTLP